MHFYKIPPIVFQWFIRLCTRFIFIVFADLKTSGTENLKQITAPVIFASNHVSEWDGPLIRSVLPMRSDFGPMFYVAGGKGFYNKSGWRKYFYESSLFQLLGAYPVYVGMRDYNESLVHHIRILRDGGSVTIFPEGKRSFDGQLKEPKAGVIALALAGKVPIIPVAISGLNNLRISQLFLRKYRVKVSFGIPITQAEILSTVDQLHPETYKVGAQLIMARIDSLLKNP